MSEEILLFGTILGGETRDGVRTRQYGNINRSHCCDFRVTFTLLPSQALCASRCAHQMNGSIRAAQGVVASPVLRQEAALCFVNF